MKLGKTAIVHFLTQVTTSLAGFVATYFIASVMGARVLGIYASAMALVFWLGIPSGAVTSAIMKRVSEGHHPRESLIAGFAVLMAFTIFVCGFIFVFTEQLNGYFEASVAHYFVLLFVSLTLFQFSTAILNGQKRVAIAGSIQAVERILRTILQIGLVVGGFYVAGLFLGHVFSLLASVGMALYFNRLGFAVPSKEHVRDLLEYAQYSWIGSLRSRAFGWMDTIVLSLLVAKSLVGIYEVAWTLASTLILVSISIRATLFPEISELNEADDSEEILHYLDEGLAFTGVFAIPGLFGALLLGDHLLSIYRPIFAKGHFVLVLLIFARLIGSINSQFVSAINAMDLPDIAFRINGIFLVSNLLLNVSFIYYIGWYGAAVATVISAGIALVMSFKSIKSITGESVWPVHDFLKQTASSLLMTVILYPVTTILHMSILKTLAVVLLGAGIYFVSLTGLSPRFRGKVRNLLVDDI